MSQAHAGTDWVKRALAVGVIAIAAWIIAWLPRWIAPLHGPVQRADEFFYDAYYKLRPIEDRRGGPVVIVAADQRSLDQVNRSLKFGWPWPRELWGRIATYISNAGARAIVFDIIFSEKSVFEDQTGDDETFADAINALKTPVVFGSLVSAQGKWDPFAPATVRRPVFGAVNVGDSTIYRRYPPKVADRPSLALAAVQAAGRSPLLPVDRSFDLHYYGPYASPDGRHTYRYVSAASVLAEQLAGGNHSRQSGVSPELFRGKIVLIGAVAAGTYDLKSSPLSKLYPGVEVQATAIDNLLSGQAVEPVSAMWRALSSLAAALLSSLGIIFWRRVWLKILAPLAVAAAVLAGGALLFHGQLIRWLTPVDALGAVILATLGAFAWSWLMEDRQRRFMLKTLSKVISPAVAQRLAREPGHLRLGTARTELTVLFSDLEGFTSLSESMDVQQVGQWLNGYLSDMSDRILAADGTLDKYIGDAVMCFWNAPLPQEDHAVRACRAALEMITCERQRQRTAFDGPATRTRIGIHTATVAVGFVGSSHLLNYTALGDGVNLASRLEGANKFYGTSILLSESTAMLVKGHFCTRKVDVLRVKGKKQPMAVYELLGERRDGEDRRVDLYEAAFAGYQRRDWESARRKLLELQEAFGDDTVAAMLLKRIAALSVASLPDNWDGVYDAKDK